MPKFASKSTGPKLATADWHFLAILEVLFLFGLVSLLAVEPVPGVNETHYLPKAKYALDAGYAANDLFLQSHNAHWLSSGFAGCLALFLPLNAVAWIGRVVSWLFLAWAWRQLRLALGLPLIFAALALLSWYFAIDYGQWAGEWAIGGFEGKSIAYPCIIAAFAQLFRGNWPGTWLWLGMAVAWHPLVGGWAGLSVGITWLCQPHLPQRAAAEFKWLALATLIGLIGVLPAASGLNSPNQDGNLVASQVHVFLRLAHHQLPRAFGTERHLAAAASLTLLVIATLFQRWKLPRQARQAALGQTDAAINWLLAIAWIAVGFSITGLLLDVSLTKTRPILASQLLRFYWFRWSDIVVPLAWTLTFWASVRGGAESLFTRPGLEPGNRVTNVPGRVWSAAFLLVGVSATLILTARHTRATFDRRVPAADDVLMDAPGNQEIATDRFVDWLAVCNWIRQSSPTDSLWFTPEFQQTFKWYAQRAEVVCWKDVPQDNASVRQWYQRVVDCRAPRNADGAPVEWTSAQILELARRYHFRWILVDRRIQTQPLLQLEIMYPIETSNRSFAVFRIPDVLE